MLIDEYTFIEVYFTGLSKDCYHIRQVVLDALRTRSDIVAYEDDKIQFTAGMYCLRKHATHIADTTPHPITIAYHKNPPAIGCSMETDLPPLELSDERMKCWLISKWPFISNYL